MPPVGFQRKGQPVDSSLLEGLPETVTPEDVLSNALTLSQVCLFIPIIEEFARLQDKEATRQFTDTIKASAVRPGDDHRPGRRCPQRPASPACCWTWSAPAGTVRTRKDNKLALTAEHKYPEPGEYRVMVKVIDILGNDTTKTVKVQVK